jgi:hypothetical protein
VVGQRSNENCTIDRRITANHDSIVDFELWKENTMPLNEKQQQMCSESKWDFSDPRARFLNCTLKKSPELADTQGLIDI